MLPRAVLARAYGITGDKAEAQKVLDHFREVSKRRFISEYDYAIANSGWNPEVGDQRPREMWMRASPSAARA